MSSVQSAAEGMRVRTQFPRFQDEYTIILQENKKNAPTTTGEWLHGTTVEVV
jgi:hypothetical protein